MSVNVEKPDQNGGGKSAPTLKTLAGVRRALRLASRTKALEVEDVHQLRVHARHGRAALRLLRDSLGADRVDPIDRGLKRLLDAAGEVRNADIAIEQLRQRAEAADSAPLRLFIGKLKQQRAGALASLERLVSRRKLRRRLKRIVAAVQRGKRRRPVDADFAAHSQQVVREAAETLLARLAEAPPGVADRLHRVRIAAKQLRYLCDLAAALPSGVDRSAALTLLKAAQENLGKANDLAMLDSVAQRLASGDAAGTRDFAGRIAGSAEQQRAALHWQFEAKHRAGLLELAERLADRAVIRPRQPARPAG